MLLRYHTHPFFCTPRMCRNSYRSSVSSQRSFPANGAVATPDPPSSPELFPPTPSCQYLVSGHPTSASLEPQSPLRPARQLAQSLRFHVVSSASPPAVGLRLFARIGSSVRSPSLNGPMGNSARGIIASPSAAWFNLAPTVEVGRGSVGVGKPRHHYGRHGVEGGGGKNRDYPNSESHKSGPARHNAWPAQASRSSTPLIRSFCSHRDSSSIYPVYPLRHRNAAEGRTCFIY